MTQLSLGSFEMKIYGVKFLFQMKSVFYWKQFDLIDINNWSSQNWRSHETDL